MARFEQLVVNETISLGTSNLRGTVWRNQAAPVTKSGAAAVTMAEMLVGIVQHTATTGVALTTPTGAAMSAGALVNNKEFSVGDSFDMSLQVVGVGADDIVTLTAGDANVTFSGSVTVGGADPAGGVGAVGVFRFRNSGTNTWVGYRIA